MTARVTFVFVLYEDYKSMLDLMVSQCEISDPSLYRVVVVDNTTGSSTDESARSALREFAGVEVLTAQNLGYSGAAQFAIETIPSIGRSEFVCLANTDLSLDMRRFSEQLVSRSGEGSLIGAIAPRLVAEDGGAVRQLHYWRRPSAASYRKLARIFDHYWLAIARRFVSDSVRSIRRGGTSDTPDEIFAPHGALMVVTRAYLENTSGFSFPTFLFCEEIYLGLECEKANLEVSYMPELTYSHRNHGSMGRIQSRAVIGYLRDSHVEAARRLEIAEGLG